MPNHRRPPLDYYVRGSKPEPSLALGGTIVRQGPCAMPIPVTGQKAEKLHLTQVENLFRPLLMPARHQPAPELEHEPADRPERRYHT
jgi:hypothetical protein